jgi:hypothetical protein
MRNLPIPVDTTRLTFVCVSPPRPRVLDQNTGEVKTDKQGQTVYAVGLSAADENGRAELLSVNVSGEPQVSVGQIVEPVELVGFAWEQTRGGELRWGISYRAAQILPATGGPAVPSALSSVSSAPSSGPSSSSAAAA